MDFNNCNVGSRRRLSQTATIEDRKKCVFLSRGVSSSSEMKLVGTCALQSLIEPRVEETLKESSYALCRFGSDSIASLRGSEEEKEVEVILKAFYDYFDCQLSQLAFTHQCRQFSV